MPRRSPDRDLRRLVADLATASAADLEAILGGLDEPQRRTVTEMLAAYAGAAAAPQPSKPPKPKPPAAPPPPRVAGLSPWLATRLRQSARCEPGAPREASELGALARGGPPGALVAMTPTALRALKACAVALETPHRSIRGAGPGALMSRVRAAVLGRRLAS